MLTLLTTTGARQEAWNHCQRWMFNQTFNESVRWIIVDDGKEAQSITFDKPGWELIVVRPEPFWSGQNTQARNLQAGLEYVEPDDRLVIIEDDDYYHPKWLQTVAKQFDNAQLVGERNARYYNIRTKTYRCMENAFHASLCSTAMQGDALGLFRKVALHQNKFIDIVLWEQAKNRHLFDRQMVVGIKGLPGRKGIGSGHDAYFYGEFDRDGSKLREWLGADSQHYMNDKAG